MSGQAASRPDPPGTADLASRGPAACLAALRGQFAREHGSFPQYAGWEGKALLGVAARRIETRKGGLHAEPGDLVLVQREPRAGLWHGIEPHDVAWTPRSGWHVRLSYGDVEDVAEEQS